jgi:hypothetical protein
MEFSSAHISLKGLTPYSQSRAHDAPKLQGELHDDYDKRTWLEHAHFNSDGNVTIPAHAFHQCVIAAAKYSKKQIPGQGKATWTAKFTSGLMMVSGDIAIDRRAEDLKCIPIYANTDGIRGSGKRAFRRYPVLYEWSAGTEIAILDPIITEDIFKEIIGLAGLFIGLGRFRPEKGGTNGRFKMTKCDWQDNRGFENVFGNA